MVGVCLVGGHRSNPLLEGWGIPSAAVIDALLSAAGYEMCPGLETQATSPEAFWQAARWWHPYYELNRQAPIAGYFHYERDVDYYPGPDDEPDDRALDLEPNSRSMADRKTAKKEAAKMTKKKPVKKAWPTTRTKAMSTLAGTRPTSKSEKRRRKRSVTKTATRRSETAPPSPNHVR